MPNKHESIGYTMPKIHLLDEQTVNKIAAGEVVEAPSSVMKELFENALDAEATHIIIEARTGGFSLLRISDNGCGMDQLDLEACLQRHATSKISSLEDLSKINTMGFRGEALAAIASVSHLKIISKSDEEPQAYSLISKNSTSPTIQPASRPRGTTVEIIDLFYNVPARKAFQKSVSASSADLTKWISQIALAYPHVHLSYWYNEILQLDLASLPANDLEAWRSRCAQTIGESFANESLSLRAQKNDWKIQGLLSHPSQNRPNRSAQQWVINGRIVSCPQLSRAVQEGYGTRLPPARFPQFIIYLDLPHEILDVNVHPQKREVRFKDLGMITNWIAHQVNLALCAKPFSKPDMIEVETLRPFQIKDDHQAVTSSANLLSEEQQQEVPESKIILPSESQEAWSFKQGKAIEPQSFGLSHIKSDQRSGNAFTGFEKSYLSGQKSFDLSIRPLVNWKRWSLWNIEWLAERFEGFEAAMGHQLEQAQLAWMHAGRAVARIRFEQATSQKNQMLSQALLLPIRFEMKLDQVQRIQSIQKAFAACGFDLTLADRLTIIIHTLPVGLQESSVIEFFNQIAKDLEDKNKIEIAEVATKLSPYLEKGADTNLAAPSDIILSLINCKQPFYSPTGKSIFKLISDKDMESRN
jgi:DNA mismatch repair protein MutL